MGKEEHIPRTQLLFWFLRLLIILTDGLSGQSRRNAQPPIRKAHIFWDHFLNKIIGSQTATRATAYHPNGVRSRLKAFNEILQDDFARKTDAFVFGIIHSHLLFQSL